MKDESLGIVRTSENSSMRWLILAFIGALVAATTFTVVGVLTADGKRNQIGLELAKAGIQLGAVTVLSLIVTQALRRFNEERAEVMKRAEVEREERRRLNEYRLTIFREAVDAYNRVKTVRRTLRAAGLTSGYGSLASRQIDEFNAQMRALNDAELSLEKVEREVRTQKETFVVAWERIDDLRVSEDYLRGVLSAWETGALFTVRPDQRQEESLQNLENFLARRSEAFGDAFWRSFDAFEGAIRADLVEPATLSAAARLRSTQAQVNGP